MSTRLVILGLLRSRPLYGYEIKHIIEEHMSDWTSIAFGSIYFALSKLADEGCIEKVATEKEGARPSRSVYQITEEGRLEFSRLLREVWKETKREYYDFDIGIFFADALSNSERYDLLQKRVEQLEKHLEVLESHRQEDMTHIPAEAKLWASAIFDHTLVHMQAELNWTRGLLNMLA